MSLSNTYTKGVSNDLPGLTRGVTAEGDCQFIKIDYLPLRLFILHEALFLIHANYRCRFDEN